MEHEATLNARMPEALKRGGTRVLEENGVSPTQIVRRLYGYMEREGCIPDCLLEPADAADLFEARRKRARSIAGLITLPKDFNTKEEREARIAQKYEELL